MPELPEVETTLNGIRPYILHSPVRDVLIRNHSLRWPIDANLPDILRTQSLNALSRRGKYLLLHFNSGIVLWHLGMSGSLRILQKNAAPRPHDHVDVLFANGNILRYHDPRRFGAVIWTQEAITSHKLLVKLGPEPLSEDFNAEYLFARSRKIKQAVKSWIMDSHVVVGVGNIYANESLFRAGIHPLKAAGKISRPAFERLTDEIKNVLTYAIHRGGTTLRDFVGGDGKPGYFAQELKVYGRAGEACTVCTKALTEKRVGQRSTVYCTHCQR